MVQWLGIHLPMQGTWARAWSGKISQAVGQLGPCTTTTEPVLPRALALQWERPPQGDACKQQLESSPHSPQLEKACAQQRSTSTAKYTQLCTHNEMLFTLKKEGDPVTCYNMDEP